MELPYTQIPNDVLRDNTLSSKAKGLLAFLLSLPNDWVLYKKTLPDYFSDGYTSISGAWDELVDSGFIVSLRSIGPDGKFLGWNHIVYYERQLLKPEIGKPEFGKPEIGKTNIGESNVGITPTTNKESTNKEETKKESTKKEGADIPARKTNKYPSKEEFVAYFEQKGYTKESGEKAYHYYADADWTDSRGNKVKNWKQKVGIVWFKPENEKPKSNGYENLLGYDARLHNNPSFRFRLSPTGTAINYERV